MTKLIPIDLHPRVHGRIGTRLGRARPPSSRSLEAALTELAAITKRRRRRGYELTN